MDIFRSSVQVQGECLATKNPNYTKILSWTSVRIQRKLPVMKPQSPKLHLKREFKRLFRAMNFISDRLARKRSPASLTRSFYEVYQQLGVAWEFLGLQCRHWDGYRKARNGKLACRICGKSDERWVLLPAKGSKVIGHKTKPTSDQTLPTKEAATITEDTIHLHGARVNVSVHNAYKSHLFRGKHDIAVASDRIVRLQENGIECWVDTHLVHVKLQTKRDKTKPPHYGAFASELPKAKLKKFPVLFRFDDRYRLQGVEIFRPWKRSKKKRREC